MPNLKITCKYPEYTTTSLKGSEEHKFDKAILKGILENHGCTDVNIVKLSSKRSLLLNSALHLWFTQIEAYCLNLGHTADVLLFKQGKDGIYREIAIKEYGASEKLCDFFFKKAIPEMMKTDLPITKSLLKDYFREVGRYLHKKDSTAKHTNEEMCQTIEACQKIFAERLGYTEEFPNKEQLLLGKLKK